MCGIVGILGQKAVAGDLVDALRRLEYRGYDSAGVATVENGHLDRRRAEGKLKNLELRLSNHPLQGRTGLGHTRWATHGKPVERNAHPHMNDRVAVVHNGIIENFQELRDELTAKGHAFQTETDTETVLHLVSDYLDRGLAPVEAAKAALQRLRGAFALAIIFAGEDNLMIGARQGPPLAIGHGQGEMYLGSDAIALAPFTDTITYLEDGDWAVLSREKARDLQSRRPQGRAAGHQVGGKLAAGRQGQLPPLHGQGDPRAARGDQPHARQLHRLRRRQRAPARPRHRSRQRRRRSPSPPAARPTTPAWSANTGWSAMRAFPSRSTSPPSSATASRRCPKGGLALFISQSGETADTLATLRYCKSQGQRIASIVNVRTSTIARESDVVLPTLAGPEIGVASTKAFTCQLVRAGLPGDRARPRARHHRARRRSKELTKALAEVPRHISTLLRSEALYEKLAHDLSKARDVLYLGRGVSYPLALEGALKLKEISYIHAEGYAAGELKHGPIALIDENVPVIVVAPADDLFEKTVSNMQEVAARGGRIILDVGRRRRAGRLCARGAYPGADGACRSSTRCSMPCRCSSSPITRPCSWAPTWTSRATSPSRLLWNRRPIAARAVCHARTNWLSLCARGCFASDGTSTGKRRLWLGIGAGWLWR